MNKRYGIVQFSRNGINVAYSVVDIELWPKDAAKFMVGHEERYRQQVLDSLKFATFGVTLRQTAPEARARATEYADFMNAQDDAMKLAKAAIKMTAL